MTGLISHMYVGTSAAICMPCLSSQCHPWIKPPKSVVPEEQLSDVVHIHYPYRLSLWFVAILVLFIDAFLLSNWEPLCLEQSWSSDQSSFSFALKCVNLAKAKSGFCILECVQIAGAGSGVVACGFHPFCRDLSINSSFVLAASI